MSYFLNSNHMYVPTDLQGAVVSVTHLTGWKQNALLPDSYHVYVLTDLQGAGVSAIHLTGWKWNVLLPDSNHLCVLTDPRGCRSVNHPQWVVAECLTC